MLVEKSCTACLSKEDSQELYSGAFYCPACYEMVARFDTAGAELFGLVQGWRNKWLEAGLTKQEAVELLTGSLGEVAGDEYDVTYPPRRGTV